MVKTALVPIAEGTEEIEAVCIIDTLRRAGVEVVVASVGERTVRSSRGVVITADETLSSCEGRKFDLIALPGGMPGSERLRDSRLLTDLLKNQARENRLYGAICAAPVVVLLHHGLLEGKKATSHPSMSGKMPLQHRAEGRVVRDGNCLTSQGPGTAIEFALALTEALLGAEAARKVAGPMVVG